MIRSLLYRLPAGLPEPRASDDLATELIQLVTNAALLTAGFHAHHRQWRRKRNARHRGQITAKAEKGRAKFQALLDKTNKENPHPKDVKALSDLLSDNRRLELWRAVASAGHLAELMVIEHARATPAVKECWKHRLQVLKKDLGSDGAPMLEQLLIQHAALCWLRLTLAELAYSSAMKGSITLTLGLYMEKRLTMAQKRFTRSCETLTRVRKLSRTTPALQLNIATEGGQQVNIA